MVSRVDRILARYPQLSDVDKRIAADIAKNFGQDPRFADRFEAHVSEYAKCMGRVEAGEIGPADVAAHMTGLAQMIGTPPDVLTNLQSHFDREIPAEYAPAVLDAESLEALLQELWPQSEEARAAVRDFTTRVPNAPHLEATLRTSAKLDQQVAAGAITQDEANARLGEFIAQHASPQWIADYKAWTQSLAGEAEPQPTPEPPQQPSQPAQPAQAQPPAPAPPPTAPPAARPAGPSREQIHAENLEMGERDETAGGKRWLALVLEG